MLIQVLPPKTYLWTLCLVFTRIQCMHPVQFDNLYQERVRNVGNCKQILAFFVQNRIKGVKSEDMVRKLTVLPVKREWTLLKTDALHLIHPNTKPDTLLPKYNLFIQIFRS